MAEEVERGDLEAFRLAGRPPLLRNFSVARLAGRPLSPAERTRRNEYGGVYNGLYRQFGIASYRRMPPARLREALEWLERWRGDLMGEPEPPPDIE